MRLSSALIRALVPLVVIGAGVTVTALLWLTRPESPVQERASKPPVVAVQKARPRALQPTLTLHGRLESRRDATLTAAVEGDITALPVREGATVAAEALLVGLERADLASRVAERQADLADARAAVAEAEAQYEVDRAMLKVQRELLSLARRGVERAERMAGRDMASQAELDTAEEALAQQRLSVEQQKRQVTSFPARLKRLQAQRDRAKARLEQARRDLERTRITAPFRARVVELMVAVGDRVRPGEALARVFDPSRVEVRASIPGPHVGRVAQALRQQDALDARVLVDGKTHAARLERLGARTPEGTAGVTALFRLREAGDRLALGRFVRVRLSLPAEPNTVAVPFSALYGRDRVYTVRDDRLQAVPVTRLGRRSGVDGGSKALVRADELTDGSRIVTTQLPEAAQGLQVRIVEDGSGGGRD